MAAVNERELPDVVVFERMPVAVRGLISNTLLSGLIRTVERESIIPGGGMVTECVPVNPPFVWSTGEQVLWQYLASLAGMGTVNLREVALMFRSSGYIVQIVEAFEAVAGLVGADQE